MDIVSSEPVFAHARIANYGGAAGSYGQSAQAVPVAWALGEDDVPGTNPDAGIATLFECREDADFRCNLGIASVANVPLTVAVTAWIGPDAVGTPLTLELEPFSHTQVNRVLQAMGVSAAGGVRLEVSAAPGSSGPFLRLHVQRRQPERRCGLPPRRPGADATLRSSGGILQAVEVGWPRGHS